MNTEQKTYEYEGFTMEYSSAPDQIISCVSFVQLGGKEQDYILLAANTEEELFEQFQTRVDSFSELVLDLTKELSDVQNLIDRFPNLVFERDVPLYYYLQNRETSLLNQLKVLTSD